MLFSGGKMSYVHTLGLKPGDIGFTKIGGRLGWWISLGQFLTGDPGKFSHVFVVLDNDEVAEAMPFGSRIQPLDRQYGSEVAYVRMNLTDEQRESLVRYGRERLERPGGIRYSFTTYLALAIARLGIKPKKLREYITKSSRQICSAMADDWLTNGAGYYVFCDQRLPQDVVPSELFYELLELPGNTAVIVDPTREGTFSPIVSDKE
jgi:hypothetical protein